MIIESIILTENNHSKEYQFSNGANLIYSAENTVGKTTLLRLICYSLGFAIPNTKNIKFEKCKTETTLCKGSKTYTIVRENGYLTSKTNDESHYYILPSELDLFHAELFGSDNIDVLDNILGAFYIDQEKGWTLLNRGKVIGSIGFNIEKFIFGLSNTDYERLQKELDYLERSISKYQQMSDLAVYQKEIHEEAGDTIFEKRDETLERELSIASFEVGSIKKELRDVTKTIADNSSFKKYIEKMNLKVVSSSGEEVPVNQDTIIGFLDNHEILLSRKMILSNQLVKAMNKVSELKKQIYYESQTPSTESLIQSFDRVVSEMVIDATAVKDTLDELKDRRKKVRGQLTDIAKNNNKLLSLMYETVEKYAIELSFTQFMSTGENSMFTHNLRELTGAVLSKMTFSFKLAYINAVKFQLSINLPIIIDSPAGKELDKENLHKMMTILNRDFSDHQIIVASIFNDYPLDNLNVIEIGKRVIY